MGPVVFSATLILLPLSLCAQRQASLGVGVGIVRHSGGSSFSALTASPGAQWLSPSRYLGAGGAVSLLDSSVWAAQGRGDVWLAFWGQPTGTRLAFSATIAGSARSDGLAAGSGTAILEAVRSLTLPKGGGGFAIGAGAVTGVIESVSGVGALRLRGRGWWQSTTSPLQFTLTTEGTRFLGAWYADLIGGVTVDRPRAVGSLWVSGRFSKTYGSTAAVSASAQYYVTPSIALEASGGNYLRDPFQGLPRAGFAALGARFYASRRALTAPDRPPTESRALLQPLVAERRGDTAVVRFRMPGAKSVAIAGNWNAWTPAPLRGLDGEIWEAALLLAPGTYYFNLVVDGSEWVVPGGVAVIPDGMGGMLAVLNVL